MEKHEEKRIQRLLPATPVNRMFPQFEEIAKKHGYEIYEHEDGDWYIVKDRVEWAKRELADEYDDTPFCGFDYTDEKIGFKQRTGFEAMIWGKIPDTQEACFREIVQAIEIKLEIEVGVDIF